MSDDLKKLMSKMQSNKKSEEKTPPIEEDVKKLEEVKASDEEIKKAVVDTPAEIDKDEETSDPIPAKEENPEHTVEAEIGLLQNDGMFRRELILVLKEFVDVMKINTQALLDIEKLAGGKDGRKD